MTTISNDSILTLEERDRRWREVRQEMEKRDLDCLVVWGSEGAWGGLAANLRYLSNLIEQGYLVFPLEGEPTMFTFEVGLTSSWIMDHRAGQPKYSSAIAKRLRELHLGSGRIGIIGLSGYWGEMGFPYTTYKLLMDTFPGAIFEDATDILEKTRLIKSAAEIECFRLGCEAGLKVVQSIRDTARAGVKELEVRANIMDTLFRNGCEPDSMLLYFSGRQNVHAGRGGRHTSASQKVLERGELIAVEFDAKYCGYIAQFNQPFAIGDPGKEWMDIFSISVESFNNGLSILRPGMTSGELDEALLSPIKEAGYTTRNPAFHGLGLYIEMPMGIYPGQPEYQPEATFVIEENMVIELEPHVVSLDGKKGVHIGSPVRVIETGCELLCKSWKPEFIIC